MSELSLLIDRISKLEQALAVGRSMRTAQSRYFKGRTQLDLIAARTLEKQFDELCAAVMLPEPASGAAP